jgi:hypothetical protein
VIGDDDPADGFACVLIICLVLGIVIGSLLLKIGG